jgi:hypothetical protein
VWRIGRKFSFPISTKKLPIVHGCRITSQNLVNGGLPLVVLTGSPHFSSYPRRWFPSQLCMIALDTYQMIGALEFGMIEPSLMLEGVDFDHLVSRGQESRPSDTCP